MERRVGGRGGRSWRPRESGGGSRPAPTSSSSSASYGDRWRPSSSRASHSASKSGGDLREDLEGSTKVRLAEHVADQDVSSLVGTCPDMCPAKERGQREQFRDLTVFERLNGNPQKTSSALAVKKFCRTMSTTNEQPSDIRPLPVLQKTLRYLLDIVDSSNHPFEVIHDFVLDRTRAIRQDLSIQKIVNNDVILMYEEMVKFHIISDKRLRKNCGKVDISSLLHLNMEQLIKSLTSLYDLYVINQRSSDKNYNEAEYYSFNLILQLGRNRNSISLWLRKMSVSILQSKEMHFARSVLRHLRVGNYRRFLKIVAADSSYLQFCLLEPVRAQALLCINYGGYKLHPYPLSHLSHILIMKEEDLESLCHDCGLKTCKDEAGHLLLPTRQEVSHMPKTLQDFGFLASEN
ncbi:unnamed protein product [Spirodela intermedia]|uniref:SAC3/GANP/THP3 conserved domain-containing protein n=1 Tax=Spirodela intermedia TaxID=51605 RepID=A0A7I8I913_SPIIN|nr:unnamed protein product [Spirodela intermedia]CAA6653974.1 unnamed protein product [Spirodela intermedia]